MPITKQRTPGYLIRIKFQGQVMTPWISMTIEEEVEVDEATAASSFVKQRVTQSQDANLELEFFNSDEFNNANLAVNSGIEEFEVTIPTDSNAPLLSPDFFTLYPPETWKVVKKSYKQDAKSGKITISVTPGHLDVGPPPAPPSGGA